MRISFAIIFLFCFSTIAQVDSVTKEKTKRDSLYLYKKIEKLSKRNRWIYEAYKSVFTYKSPTEDTTAKKIQSPKKTNEIRKRKTVRIIDMSDYDGRIIKNVFITSLDPSGYSITDTLRKPENFAERAANLAHIKSKRFTIRNHLLFKRGDSLDHFKVKESERIIRTSAYIHDAIIRVEPAAPTGDSVNVYIRTQDRWSLSPTYNYGGPWTIGLKDENFLGFGQSVEQSAYKKEPTLESPIYYKGTYVVPYIRNTFITALGFYNTDIQNQNKGVALFRPFYSPLTRWAGGADLSNFIIPTVLKVSDSLVEPVTLNYTNTDVWNGWSFPVFKSKESSKRGTRFIVAARYYHQDYKSTIDFTKDKFLTFQTTDTYFTSFSLSQRQYYKDKYIYRFGTTEDVPTGFLLSLITGVQNRPLGTNRTYGGIRCVFNGHLPNLIYVNAYLESGSYFNQSVMEQAVTRIGFGTFTSLINIGRWKWRQFLVSESTYGMNRGFNEIISINNESGLRGFSSPTLVGTNKFIVYLQTQLYLPYQVLGFSFAPVMYVGMGMVGTENNLFIKNQPFPVFALGVQFRNELLVFNTFQFTFGFYPEIPGVGYSVFKFNPVRTYDLQFRQFSVDKPGEIPYY
ncbi:MAG: hypothetical protein H7329_06190 [Opitutaceae bacterium]|nr:hypothetical protein [Cytophagales bacterium]